RWPIAAPPETGSAEDAGPVGEAGPPGGDGAAEAMRGAAFGLRGLAAARAPCFPPPPVCAAPPGACDMPTPFSPKPAAPWPCRGRAYSCALTDRLGSESPPIVCSTPPWYLVTTSTCPSNSTQSPGCGAYPSPSACQRP